MCVLGGGGDLRNTMWREKGPLEPPEPQLWLKQERVADKPSHRLVDGAFSKLLLPEPPPLHPPPSTRTHRHTHNPNTCRTPNHLVSARPLG